MRFYKSREMIAADLFLPFDQESQIARQLNAARVVGFDGFQMGKELAFVVGRAPREKGASFDARLERRRFPKFKRLGWLHIVVAIDEEVRLALARRARRLRHEDQISGRGIKPCRKPKLLAVLIQPSRAGFQIAAMLGLGGNAGEPQVFGQFTHKTRLVLAEKFFNGLHVGRIEPNHPQDSMEFPVISGAIVAPTRHKKFPEFMEFQNRLARSDPGCSNYLPVSRA